MSCSISVTFALISRAKEPEGRGGGGFDRVRRRIDGSVSSSLYFSPGLIPFPSTVLFHGKILRRAARESFYFSQRRNIVHPGRWKLGAGSSPRALGYQRI